MTELQRWLDDLPDGHHYFPWGRVTKPQFRLRTLSTIVIDVYPPMSRRPRLRGLVANVADVLTAVFGSSLQDVSQKALALACLAGGWSVLARMQERWVWSVPELFAALGIAVAVPGIAALIAAALMAAVAGRRIGVNRRRPAGTAVLDSVPPTQARALSRLGTATEGTVSELAWRDLYDQLTERDRTRSRARGKNRQDHGVAAAYALDERGNPLYWHNTERQHPPV